MRGKNQERDPNNQMAKLNKKVIEMQGGNREEIQEN